MAIRLMAMVAGGALLGLGIGLALAVPGPGVIAGIGAGLLIAATVTGDGRRPASADA